jgi:hypothetical protein
MEDERDLLTVLRLRRAVVISQLESMIDRRSLADFAPGDYRAYQRLCDEERALLRSIREQELVYPFG